MNTIVPNKPACRHCGTPVKPLHRCPRCRKRAILSFFLPRSGARW